MMKLRIGILLSRVEIYLHKKIKFLPESIKKQWLNSIEIKVNNISNEMIDRKMI